MRCFALAQWAGMRDIPVRFCGRVLVPWVRQRLLKDFPFFVFLDGEVPPKESPEDLLHDLGTSPSGAWAVLDGYHFGPDSQQALRNAGFRVLVVDDYAHLPEYSCDMLLNQNPGSEKLLYKGDIGISFFGPKYALLRPEFAAAREKMPQTPFGKPVHRILLTLGGGNASSHLETIAPILTLPELANTTLFVVRGNMPEEKIILCLKDCPARLEILTHVTDMPNLLRNTDLCITAGGSTCWELCCLGVPFLTVQVAENQKEIVAELETLGVAPRCSADSLRCSLGNFTVIRHQTEKTALLCDGTGAPQLLDILFGGST